MNDALDNSRRNPLRLVMQHVPVPWVFVLTYLCGVGLEYALPMPPALKALVGAKLAGAGLFVAGAALAGWGWATFRRALTTAAPGQAASRLGAWGPERLRPPPLSGGRGGASVG